MLFQQKTGSVPEEEVGALMGLFKQYLKDALEDLLNDDIKIRFGEILLCFRQTCRN